MFFAEVPDVFEPALELAIRCADAHTVALCADLLERPRAKQRGVREWLATALLRVQAPPSHPPTDLDVWTQLVAREPDDDTSAQELLERIRANPADPALRAVYADVLQERGDPRGAFVALQLEETLSAESNAARLFRKHGQDWLGPELSRVLTNVVFRGGFLHRASLSGAASASSTGWARAAEDPRLRTLVRLGKGRGNRQLYGDFLVSAVATALADVEIPFSSVLDRLLDCPHPRRLRVLRTSRIPTKYVDRLARSPHFTELSTVVLGGPGTRDPDRFLREAVSALRRAQLPVHRIGVEAPLEESAPRETLAAEDGLGALGLTHLELGCAQRHITLVRQPDASLRVEVYSGAIQVADTWIPMLGPRVDHVVIYEASWVAREATMDAEQQARRLRALLDGVPVQLVPADQVTPRQAQSDASGVSAG